MIDAMDGDAARSDALADIDRALGPALDPFLRRMLPGRDRAEREQIRKEIVEYIGDVISTERTTPA